MIICFFFLSREQRIFKSLVPLQFSAYYGGRIYNFSDLIFSSGEINKDVLYDNPGVANITTTAILALCSPQSDLWSAEGVEGGRGDVEESVCPWIAGTLTSLVAQVGLL